MEVTRAYQQVQLPGKKKLGFTEALVATFECWAAAVGDRTVGIRTRGYVLHLGPGVLGLRADTAGLFAVSCTPSDALRKPPSRFQKSTPQGLVWGRLGFRAP